MRAKLIEEFTYFKPKSPEELDKGLKKLKHKFDVLNNKVKIQEKELDYSSVSFYEINKLLLMRSKIREIERQIEKIKELKKSN